MKKMSSNLDERQELTLLRIESRGCWLAFWGLLAALVVESLIYDMDFERLAGEWIVFMVLALYLAFGCAKNGIWDRHLKPNGKTNLIVSIIAGTCLAVFNFLTIFSRYPDFPMGALAAALITGVATAVICFVAISALSAYTKRKQRKMEEEPEE